MVLNSFRNNLIPHLRQLSRDAYDRLSAQVHFQLIKCRHHLLNFISFKPVHLEEIDIKLKGEDPTTRPLRCTVAFLDILNKVNLII